MSSFPTSYIKTTTATVTRNLGVPEIDDTDFPPLYNSAAFSLSNQFRPQSASGTLPIWTISDGTANERIRLVIVSGTLRAQVDDGGVNVADVAIGAVTADTDYRCAVGWDSTGIYASLNGAAVESDTSITLPTVDRIVWGPGQTTRETRGFPRRLSNAQLQLLSA